MVYSVTYACVKLLSYSLLFWLPFYLSEEYSFDSALIGTLASTLEVGSIVGALSIGFATDKLSVRSPVIVPILALSIPLLVFLSLSPAHWLLYILIFFIGFSIVGCNHIISSAIAADLATNHELAGNQEMRSTVAGIIDGSGGFGAAIGQVSVRDRQIGSLLSLSWEAVFYFLIGNPKSAVASLAVVLLGPTARREFLKMRTKSESSPQISGTTVQ